MYWVIVDETYVTYGLTDIQLWQLQSVQNDAAQLVMGTWQHAACLSLCA